MYLERVDSPQLCFGDPWPAVRDLKAKLEGVCKSLENQEAIDTDPNPNNAVLTNLLSSCRTPHELAKTGLLAAQKMLDQRAEKPNAFPAIFAIMAVSNCMYSHLSQLYQQPCNPIHISQWVEALSSPEEKLFLEHLWKILWPNLDRSPYLNAYTEAFETEISSRFDQHTADQYTTEQSTTNHDDSSLTTSRRRSRTQPMTSAQVTTRRARRAKHLPTPPRLALN